MASSRDMRESASFVMGDASVQFLQDSIDMLTYNRLGGKADGGAISGSF